MGVETGTVVVNHGTRTMVEAEDGSLVRCSIRGKRLRPVCGDRVEWSHADGESGVIHRILDRQRALERADGRGGTEPVASALDRVLIVIASEPAPDPVLIDRYLVMCERADIEAAILVNKSDIEAGKWMTSLEGFERAGYPLWSCSALTGHGLSELVQRLGGRTTLMAGQSGVGKSSLLNAIIPDIAVQTGLLAATGEGRHTTTTTISYRLPEGGILVDSPGVREFWLPEMPAMDLVQGFREIATLSGQCRFRDCVHAKEPGCAVIEAVEHGELDARRYRSYLALHRALCGR